MPIQYNTTKANSFTGNLNNTVKIDSNKNSLSTSAKLQINIQDYNEVKIQTKKVLKTLKKIKINEQLINTLKKGELPSELLTTIELLKNPRVTKLLIRALKKELYTETKKIRKEDPRLEKTQSKEKLFHIEILKNLLDENLNRINKNLDTTTNNPEYIFFKSTIKGINPKLSDFLYDEDIFEVKINNAIENNEIHDKLINLLKNNNQRYDLHPVNPYFEEGPKCYYCGDTAPVDYEDGSPSYERAIQEEENLLNKVPLFKKDKDKINSKDSQGLKIAMGAVGGLLITCLTGGLGIPTLGALATAVASERINNLSAEELKKEYSHTLHKAALIAALKEAIVEGKITSKDVMDICKNN